MGGTVTTSLMKHPDEATVFDWLKRLFGEGNIYFDFVCDDGSTGRGKSPYIGDPATFDQNEYSEQIKAEIWHKHGKKVTQISNVRLM